MKLFYLIFGVLVLSGLVSAGILDFLDAQEEEVFINKTFTSTTDTTCKDGVCNLILYSSVRNVFEDGEWKRIENAKSLKGYYKVKYLKEDSDYEIEIEDFNYTCLKKLKIKSEVGGSIPFKLNHVNYVSPSMEKGEEIELENICMDNILSYNFTLGKHSTTIQLISNLTEVLEDAYTYNAGPGGAQCNSVAYVKFNISSIPEGQSIDDSTLCLFIVQVGVNWGDNINFSNINDQTWDESDSAAELYGMTFSDTMNNGSFSIIDDTYVCSSILDIVNVDYGTNDYVSVRIENPDETSSGSSASGLGNFAVGDNGGFCGTEDFFVVVGRAGWSGYTGPYLNITYSAGAPPENCWTDEGTYIFIPKGCIYEIAKGDVG